MTTTEYHYSVCEQNTQEMHIEPTVPDYNIGFETIICLCCYEKRPISMKAFLSCKASEDKKHLICNTCFSSWGSERCFFCDPLNDGRIEVSFSPRVQNNIIVNNIQADIDSSNSIIEISDISVNSSASENNIMIMVPNNNNTNSKLFIEIFNIILTMVCWFVLLVSSLTILFLVI